MKLSKGRKKEGSCFEGRKNRKLKMTKERARRGTGRMVLTERKKEGCFEGRMNRKMKKMKEKGRRRVRKNGADRKEEGRLF